MARKVAGIGAQALFPEAGPIAGALGEGAADALLKPIIGDFEGYGDYKLSSGQLESNTVMGIVSPEAAQVPTMHRDKGATRITHREYIGDMSMTTAFSLKSFTISPASADTFPWLSTIAPSFQEYQIMGCVFEFKSLSANAVSGTNAGMGSITAAVNYDVYSTPPQSKTQIANALFAVSCKPSEDMMCPLECEPAENVSKVLHIDQGQPGLERHFYDFARLDVVTQGSSGDYPGACEIWATYDIMLIKPVVAGVRSGAFHMQITGSPAGAIVPLATSYAQPVFNNLGLTVNGPGTQLIFPPSLPPGWYEIRASWLGAVTPNLGPPTIVLANGLSYFQNINGSPYYPDLTGLQHGPWYTPNGANTLCNSTMLSALVFYNGAGTAAALPNIVFNAGVFPTTQVGGDLWVQQCNPRIMSNSTPFGGTGI